MNPQSVLPIDSTLPEILSSLKRRSNLVIEAAPGAGKTTRVPPAVLTQVAGQVLVLEPRRIAARMSARRVASERCEELGESVGYQVRFEDRTGPRTRLRFITEGILTRRFISDPQLTGVDAVILDEFHERHLDGDLALALLRRLQRTRPELKIIVMSATLDAAPIAHFLDGCPIIRSEGRMFPLSIRHIPYSPESLQMQLNRAVQSVLARQGTGNILAFLPGLAEIRQSARECEALAHKYGILIVPLHGDLSPAEQDFALSPLPGRRLILATNVAESSVTVEGVTAVIDSGLARIATHSPWTGLPTLQIGRVSKASANQRAGRAGRLGPGEVIRIYPEEDFRQRPEQDTPEILRSDLSQLLLALRSMKIAHPQQLEWLDAPPAKAVQAAETLLDQLGADEIMAQRMARFPLAPRLARMVIAAIDRGVGEAGCRIAAMLSLGTRSDSNEVLNALDQPTNDREKQQTEQLVRIARVPRQARQDDGALLLALLAGFPDRVARRRSANQILLCTGISAEVHGSSPSYEFSLAIDAEDRRENPLPFVRMTARLEPEWLLELFPDRVKETSQVVWNRQTERVEQVNALVYEKLAIEESRGSASDRDAAQLLARQALETGIEQFVDTQLLDHFLARLSFAGFDHPQIPAAFEELCFGLHSFSELRAAAESFPALLEQKYDSRRLNGLAPLTITLSNGRKTKIHYQDGRPPWIASRLQDFFGMHQSPRIGPGLTPVVVHLLAPNQRAVQTTVDLAGFWERLYPQVRKELMRRYPRHLWPERP